MARSLNEPGGVNIRIGVWDRGKRADRAISHLENQYPYLSFEPVTPESFDQADDRHFDAFLISDDRETYEVDSDIPTLTFESSVGRPSSPVDFKDAIESLLPKLSISLDTADLTALQKGRKSLLFDDKLRCVYATEETAEFFDSSKTHLFGRTIRELYDEGVEETLCSHIELLDAGESVDFEEYSESREEWYTGTLHRLSTGGVILHFEKAVADTRADTESSTFSAALRETPFPLFTLNIEFEVCLWNEEAAHAFGWSEESLLGHSAPLKDEDRNRFEYICAEVFNDETSRETILSIRTETGKTVDAEIAVIPHPEKTPEQVICIAHDIHVSESVRNLEKIKDARRSFAECSDADQLAETGIDELSSLLAPAYVSIYRYDRANQQLEPAAFTSGFTERFGSVSPITPDENYIWSQFDQGTSRYVRDLDSAPVSIETETEIQSELIVPLQSQGVLILGATRPHGFNRLERDIVEILANIIGHKLTEFQQQQRVEDYKKQLRFQSEKPDEKSTDIRTFHSLIESFQNATTQKDFIQSACRTLLDIEDYPLVGFCKTTNQNGFVPYTWLTDTVSPAFMQTRFSQVEDLLEEAMESRELQARSLADLDGIPEQHQTRHLGVAALPILDTNREFGVLVLGLQQFQDFTPADRRTLEKIGDHLRLGSTLLEALDAPVLEEWRTLSIKFDSGAPFSQLASEFGTDIDLISLRQSQADHLFARIYADIEIDEAEELCKQIPWIKLRGLRDDADEEDRLECELEFETTIGTQLLAFDARVLSSSVTPDQTVLTVQIPTDISTTKLKQALDRECQVTIQEQKHAPGDIDFKQVWTRIQSELTSRQFEVLETSFEMGFYNWPRTHSGQEVADELDISQPTFHHHLRTAERKIFELLFNLQRTSDSAESS